MNEFRLDDNYFMREALKEAKNALQAGEIPIGAVVVCNERIIARAHNMTELLKDVTAHAEMQAITAASNFLGSKYLNDCTLYVTVEPCVMCAGAIFWSGIGRVIFGIDALRLRVFRGEVAEQKDAELSCRDVFDASPRPIECIGPVMLDECSAPHLGFWQK